MQKQLTQKSKCFNTVFHLLIMLESEAKLDGIDYNNDKSTLNSELINKTMIEAPLWVT